MLLSALEVDPALATVAGTSGIVGVLWSIARAITRFLDRQDRQWRRERLHWQRMESLVSRPGRDRISGQIVLDDDDDAITPKENGG